MVVCLDSCGQLSTRTCLFTAANKEAVRIQTICYCISNERKPVEYGWWLALGLWEQLPEDVAGKRCQHGEDRPRQRIQDGIHGCRVGRLVEFFQADDSTTAWSFEYWFWSAAGLVVPGRGSPVNLYVRMRDSFRGSLGNISTISTHHADRTKLRPYNFNSHWSASIPTRTEAALLYEYGGHLQRRSLGYRISIRIRIRLARGLTWTACMSPRTGTCY